MNSASSCFSDSAVAFGEAKTVGRAIGRIKVATRKATASTERNVFMESSVGWRAYFTPAKRQLNELASFSAYHFPANFAV
jgi:hypothetical protein